MRAMTDTPDGLPDSIPLSLEREIDKLCVEFEMAWRAEQQPRIEDYLDRVPVNGRVVALRSG